MTLLHCPLCVGLAVLSIVRAAADLSLVALALPALRPGVGSLAPLGASAGAQQRLSPA
ncbi:MAG: hypothetical protein VKI83_08415 [Synechococcaceae cyanobacterium]|nr:hypothetical protein [Synechococcaceae cyanobacterium]